ncbi:hypothetical protein K7432_004498 [Basidiobolus ranarum]|uniref:Uncharacterized protein n=1 Tax=Basidiobolus ranarum TaxID=34480 RepID=A0ABR2W4T0_9FUNG
MRTNQVGQLHKSTLNKGEFWMPVRRGSIQLCDTTTVVASDKSLGKRNSLVATMLRLTPNDDTIVVPRKRPTSTYISFPHFEDESPLNSEENTESTQHNIGGLMEWMQKISLK